MPNHYVGDLLSTIEMSGLSRVRTELVQLAVVQSLTPHPVQMHRQAYEELLKHLFDELFPSE